ncbi:MAG: glycosyltransferase [Betaproteobacteria bacterium]|nr:glycosyltransferase [Betaproteobacteria bacterium]
MRLSIVIPVLNEAANLGAALAPLQGLRAKGHEVIVVDGGSVDATLDVARRYADRVIASARGRARQLNAGLSAVSGDVVLLLHADTCLPLHADQRIEEALTTRVWGRFDVRIAGRSRWLPLVSAMMNLRSRLTGIATGDQAIFAWREALVSIGGVPDLPLMEDVALSKKLRRLSPPACLRERVTTSGRRWMANGPIRTITLMWALRLAFFLGVSPDRLARAYYPPGRTE